MIKRTIQLTLIAKLSLLFFILGIFANVIYKHYSHYNVRHIVMSSDMEGYYQYLPYVLLKDKEDIKKMGWAKPYEENKTLNVFTCGVAIMQFPFFVAAHGITKFLDMEANGYGPIYFISVFFATLFYVMLGLIFLYKTLLRYFNQRNSFLGAILIFYATNLFYYTIMSPGMSHAYSFSLIAIFLYYVPVFYEKPNIKSALLVSFPIALATLIRPTNVVIGIYFILFNTNNLNNFKNRLLLFTQKWYLMVLMVIVGFLVFLPQMLYWHFVTGKFIFYSYQVETFTNFLQPKIGIVLFGKQNGWFIYTPLMIIATLGLIFSAHKNKLNAFPTLMVLVGILYLNGSWWTPTFSAAAGYRAMIEYLPLMAIPLTWVIEKVFISEHRKLKILLKSVLIIFVVYNLLFAYKYAAYFWWDTEWGWGHLLKLIRF